MGRPSLGHSVSEITKLSFRSGLKGLCSFDEDLNGNNGEEYTKKEALEAGYSSTVEYEAVKAYKKHGVSEQAIFSVIEGTIGSDGYYHEYEYQVIDVGHSFIVSIAYTCG